MRLGHLVERDAPLTAEAEALSVAGLTADSRAVKPGFVFAALPGTHVDGTAFIPQAVAAGAAAVVAAPGTDSGGVPLIASANPRRLFAHMAARFYGRQPDTIVAVTGTSGKTSVATFVREIWTAMGFRAASLGTVGVVSPSGTIELEHTTPDAMKLQEIAALLAAEKVEHLAIEASSHGLDQYRLDGLRIAAAGFTNLSHDHLDYHPTVDDYFNAKMRLFEDLVAPGGAAVINVDTPRGEEAAKRAAAHGLKVWSVGIKGQTIRVEGVRRDAGSQHITVSVHGRRYDVDLPLAGDFQVSNALIAAGLVLATGGDEPQVMHALQSLKGAKGRLELVGRSRTGAPVFVDYAHKPDALENALASLRPYTRGRLFVVFGCGGDRDRAKRPIMGEIATRLADRVYVTDDNPRTEEPASIRAAIMAAAPGAIEIGSRAAAIRAAVDALQAGDVLIVAGKGHEEGQKIGKQVLPFSDHEAVKAAIQGRDYHG
ncbi:UDP-N-acetylmuramoyl-L-alanyl-D-glutamate--2,6-diaminopimelate ligase [Aestuariivirga litoralis]|uniref:UDP-N-acetylmuramoyl-L-alanyl-D-glutamate--2,6-diaminopimelate ligase n=1 Tax=Aestuariivirga litoralis TaxID=2650924 RepID=A0A2W2BRS8_9HYPH|nr:UDP-N-acetylmuramoyl-L-alanyl-D-glutamate--2,6-diaminopimelate ligase [Aestuariivirga litoralis]PZF76126.1 UDP-N-acetylmuramoyl-L-alanyl-D-glutamate--2,6-diaminopimelate ligase [Aestuariivirga litoralis]